MRIATYLPERMEANAAKSVAKTGIRQRPLAAEGESALDLATAAAQRLFAAEGIDPASIGFLILCTQSSQYRLPSTSCLLQTRLGLPTSAGAVTIDHGCSGFIYALALAKGLLAGGLTPSVLVVTAETYSRYVSPEDWSTRSLFGDGAAATLLTREDLPRLGSFVLGTDGSGAEKLIVEDGQLTMDGPDIFNFTLDVVPPLVDEVLAKNQLTRDEIDLYVFHQANGFMLETLRKVMGLPREKFIIRLETTGNTVSSTIPLALKSLADEGRLVSGQKILLVGFGVGLSWGATVITI